MPFFFALRKGNRGRSPGYGREGNWEMKSQGRAGVEVFNRWVMRSDGIECDWLGGAVGTEEWAGSRPGLWQWGDPVPATAEVGRREERDGARGAGTEARPGKGTGMEDLRGLQAQECVLGQDREKMLGFMGKEPGIWRKNPPWVLEVRAAWQNAWDWGSEAELDNWELTRWHGVKSMEMGKRFMFTALQSSWVPE